MIDTAAHRGTDSARPGALRRSCLLAAIAAAAALAWLVVLPRVAHQPRVRASLEAFEANGIDPSAMFYTELGAMEDVLARLPAGHRQPEDAPVKPLGGGQVGRVHGRLDHREDGRGSNRWGHGRAPQGDPILPRWWVAPHPPSAPAQVAA